MKKRVCLAALLLALSLAGCAPEPQSAAPATETTVPETTVQPETLPPPPVYTEPVEAFAAGSGVEDVILYFNEVCLDAEFVNSGDPSFLQKWEAPIRYRIHGNPTEEDLAVLRDFSAQLNSIHGFPGIREAGGEETANLRIHFCSQEEMVDLMGSQFSHQDGAVTFWYRRM